MKAESPDKRRALKGQPRNFPPYLVPIFCEEATLYLNGDEFNPRIQIVNQGGRAPLRIRWRRQLVGTHQFVNSLLVLDATADLELLKIAIPDGDINLMFDISARRTPEPASNAMIAFVLLSLDALISCSVFFGFMVWRITSGVLGAGMLSIGLSKPNSADTHLKKEFSAR